MTVRRLPSAIGLAGAGACLAALVPAAFEPTALAGWLVAFLFWSSLPLGALCLIMMIRLIPGVWSELLAPSALEALALLPLAILTALPILVDFGALYGWAAAPPSAGFRGLYLSTGFFVLRTLVFFGAAAAGALLLVIRPRWSVPLAAAGLIAFALLDTTFAVDWLMSLDTSFHSSGFGLYVLSIQITVALSLLIIRRLTLRGAGGETGVLGALLLTLLLLWAYFAFMQYFISWSDNLASTARWYARRAEGAWSFAEVAIGVLGLLPLFLLFFSPIRRGRRWLIGLCVVVLAGKALEIAWLALPAVNTGSMALLVGFLAIAGLGALGVFVLIGLPAVLVRREKAAP